MVEWFRDNERESIDLTCKKPFRIERKKCKKWSVCFSFGLIELGELISKYVLQSEFDEDP